MAALVPGLQVNVSGTRGTLADVGGTNNLQNMTLTMHGGRSFDTRLMVDGIRIGNAGSGGEFTNYVPDMGSTQELVIDYAAISAEQMTGGVRLNYVPKDGGNSLSGSVFATGVNDKFQSDNLDDELVARGLTAPNKMKLTYDVNAGVGGPIKRDKLWFYSAVRWQDNESFVAGSVSRTRTPASQQLDLRAGPVAAGGLLHEAAERERAAHLAGQPRRTRSRSSATTSGATGTTRGRFIRRKRRRSTLPDACSSLQGVGPPRSATGCCSRPACQEQGRGLPRRGAAGRDIDPGLRAVHRLLLRGARADVRQPGRCAGAGLPRINQNLRTWLGNVSYVTGAHSFKAGYSHTWAKSTQYNDDVNMNLGYQFNHGIPNAIYQRATPYFDGGYVMTAELGLYAQDRWTVQKMTVNAGVRFDYLTDTSRRTISGRRGGCRTATSPSRRPTR